jgi:four helix bundle protein
MTKVTRFEDLIAWQKAKDFALKDQMRRSTISIPAIIAEGFERDGNKEFIKFLSIAKGSAGELRSHLLLALDQGYLSNSDYEPIEILLLETSRLIGGLMNYLKMTEKKGRKFKE